MECSTDEFGKTQRIELNAPDSSHSTDIHSLTRQYGQYDIHVAKEGYDTEVRNGVQIFAETDSTLSVVIDVYKRQDDDSILLLCNIITLRLSMFHCVFHSAIPPILRSCI